MNSATDSAVTHALAAWNIYRNWSPQQIVGLLTAIADELDGAKEELVPVAMTETNLPKARLDGEVGRASGQFRLMAQAVLDPTYLDIVIDKENATLTPPRPELRSISMPLGVVGIFGASNFPFAFGVAGGDTASALAAGCAVVIKINPGHPIVSTMVGEIMVRAASSVGAPAGLISVISGLEAGMELVKHKDLRAVAFTGSTHGGRALFDAINAREIPIPFYGELGGLNPIFVTENAIAARAKTIAEGFLGSITLGAGQFCTKPGFLIGIGADAINKELAQLVLAASPQKMLNERTQSLHDSIREEMLAVQGMKLVAQSNSDTADASVTVMTISAQDFLKNKEGAMREVFGPTAVVIDCASKEELLNIARSFSGTLASGIHAEVNDSTLPNELLPILEDISGRIVWNQWPTGLAVVWAMHHGGPYPASTNPLFTSVGARALLRFRRPIAYQNFPSDSLPTALRDNSETLKSARIDGKR
jgi:NADP-dependent aldehyde dehydrogenase